MLKKVLVIANSFKEGETVLEKMTSGLRPLGQSTSDIRCYSCSREIHYDLVLPHLIDEPNVESMAYHGLICIAEDLSETQFHLLNHMIELTKTLMPIE